MIPEAHLVEKITKQLESWDIKVDIEKLNQQIENMSRKLQIMSELMDINNPQLDHDTTGLQSLKGKLIDISLEENKIVFDRLAKI